MKLSGEYYNRLGQLISVSLTNGDETDTEAFGNEDFGLAEDPIEIETSVNDTFDVIVKSSATITIVTRKFTQDFFAKNARDVTATVQRDGEVIFSGYVEPMSLSQDFINVYDDMDLNCVDYLSTLENYNYKGVGTTTSYDAAKASASQRTFADIMKEILGSENVYYDQSKTYSTKAKSAEIFTKTSISDLLFLGDSEDDVWTQEETLEAILKYFDLHIVQIGTDFFIFSWATVKADSDTIDFVNVFSGEKKAVGRKVIPITPDVSASDDASISMGDIYNQIKVKCDLEAIEDVIEPPLEEESLKSPYPGKQLYMREYWSDGEGQKAIDAFSDLMCGVQNDYEQAGTTDWYLQVKSNQKWAFGYAGNDIISQMCSDGQNQQAVPNWMSKNIGAAIVSLGSVKKQLSKNDNSPTAKVDMTDYLVISINGNGKDDATETDTTSYPAENDIKAAIPVATYNGNVSGGNFSPADEKTTNYIVISGSVVLNPIMGMTADYKSLKGTGRTDMKMKYWHKTVPSRNNDDGRYYTQEYFKAEKPTYTAVEDTDITQGLVPFTDDAEQLYEFKYSAIGDSSDTISKVAVLQCMLIIGDKCVVETGTQGQVTDFAWKTYKERSECASDDEYYQQSFTVGFNPKIGDKLIGTEFSIQNNVDYTLGLDEEGTAIPIKMSDHISGKVKFIILGPVNMRWSNITRRHPSFWRHTKWTDGSVLLLAHTSSIMLKEFEIKVTSDNGGNTNGEDNDIVYVSDTDEEFVNKQEQEFKINSALTTEECEQLGAKSQVSLSTPISTETRNGILSLTDLVRKETAKPEQLYVDAYYQEWNEPRAELEMSVVDKEISFFDKYRHPALTGKEFYTTSVTRHVNDGEAEIKIRERDD